MSSYRFFTLLGILSGLSGGLVFLATASGAGLSHDSAVYLSAARGLLGGQGLVMLDDAGRLVPMTHFPPLFPLAIAGVAFLGVPLLEGARWLNLFLFVANIFLAGFIAKRCVYGFSPIALGGALLIALNAEMVIVHSMVWSEPVFLCLAFLGTFCLLRFIHRPDVRFLLLGAGFLGAAPLARYAGLALLASAAGSLLIFYKRPLTERLKACLLFGAVSAIPLGTLLLRNMMAGGSAANREIGFHPPTGEHAAGAWLTLCSWVLPGSALGRAGFFASLFVFAGLLLVGRLLVIKRKEFTLLTAGGTHFAALPGFLGLFILAYLGLLVATITFFTVDTPFDLRLLAPVYAAGVLLAVYHFHRVFVLTDRGRFLKTLFLLLGAAFIALHAAATFHWVRQARLSGQGYAAAGWQHSRLVESVRRAGDGTVIYTNLPRALYFLSNRVVYAVPSKINPSTLRVNASYLEELARMEQVLRQRQGALLYFREDGGRWYLPGEEELKARLPLRPAARDATATLYRVDF